MSYPFEQHYNDEFQKLTPEQQAEVMSFIRGLKGTSQGTAGRELLQFAGVVPSNALAEMRAAITEGCEQVDQDAW